MLPIITLAMLSCGEGSSAKKTVPVAQQLEPEEEPVPQLVYKLVAIHPHDSSAYTEGLLFHNGQLYESTGAPSHMPSTRSALGSVDPKTGHLQIKAEIDRKIYFGEGMCILNNKVYQLTYQNQIAFVYDFANFKQIAQFNYQNKEGWGLTTNGKQLIMSDGSSQITFIDPATFLPVKKLVVAEGGYEVFNLNELELVNGYLFANVWQTNRIVKIDTASGKVVGNLDLSGIMAQAIQNYQGANEMNGIAYNPDNGHFYITGKMWSKMYEIEVVN